MSRKTLSTPPKPAQNPLERASALLARAMLQRYTTREEMASQFGEAASRRDVLDIVRRHRSDLAVRIRPALVRSWRELESSARRTGAPAAHQARIKALRRQSLGEIGALLDDLKAVARFSDVLLRQGDPPVLDDVIWRANDRESTDLGPIRRSVVRDGDTIVITYPKSTVRVPKNHETGVFRAYDTNGQGGTLLGTKDGREGVSYAYFKVLELTAALGACANWRFVQLKKATTTEKKKSGEKTQVQPSPGQDPDAWSTDSVPKSSDPAYPKTGGQAAMVDTPGWFLIFPPPAADVGSEIERKATYRTWVYCCNPAGLLGYFEWGFSMKLTIGATRAETTCSITPDPVSWKPKSTDAEYVRAEADFNRIVSKEAFPGLCK